MVRGSSKLCAALLSIQLLLAGAVHAQEAPVATSTAAAEALGQPEVADQMVGELRCDEYLAQSMEGTATPLAASVIAGAPLPFAVSLTNDTAWPQVQVDVHLMLVRQDGASRGTIVEYKTIATNETFAAGVSHEFSYTWQVPNNLPAGTYYPVLYVESNGVTLLGGPLGVVAPRGEERFLVTAAETTSVQFDTNASLLNETDFDHVDSMIYIEENTQHTVSVTVTNPTTEAKTVPLQWNQYAYTTVDEAHRKNTKTELVTIPAGETKQVSYTIAPQAESVLLVTATVVDGQTRNVVGFPLKKHGGNEVLLQTDGLAAFPTDDMKDVAVYACVRATSEPVVQNAEVTLTVSDESGAVVASHTYTGEVSGLSTGVGRVFTFDRTYRSLTLKTAIAIDGKIVSETTKDYSCAALAADACPATVMKTSLIDMFMTYKYMIAGGALLLLIGLLYLLRRRRQVPVIIASVALFAALVAGLPGVTEAKGVTWSSDLPTAYPNYTLDTSVSYYATIQTAGGAAVTDGGTVNVGDELQITVAPFSSGDIRWTPEGSAAPTLYPRFTVVGSGVYRRGYFNAGASLPGGFCTEENAALFSATNPICIGAALEVGTTETCLDPSARNHLIPIVVAPPAAQITTGGTADLSCNAAKTACTVTSAGTISVAVSLSATQLRMYHKTSDVAYTSCSNSAWLTSGEYTTHTIPAQSINFSLSVSSGGSGSCVLGSEVVINDVDGSTSGSASDMRTAQECNSLNYVSTAYGGTGIYGNYASCGALTAGSLSPNGACVSRVVFNPNSGVAYRCEVRGHECVVPVVTGRAPNAPTITGANTGTPGTSYPFTFTATDPDNDQIFYEVDWNNDGVVDQRAPASTLVNSGVGQSSSYSWATIGGKTFKARTVDAVGNRSTWAQHTITLAVSAATADLKINNSDGPLSINRGTTAAITWSSTNATGCTIYGADLPGGALANQPATGSYTITNAQSSDTYAAVCGAANDEVALTVTNTDPPTANLQASVNGGAWSNEDRSVDPDDTVRIRWSSYNATTCTGSGFNTGGITSSTGGVVVATPAPSNSTNFGINCSGATDSLRITTRQLPNFSQPNIATPQLAGFNAATGIYSTVDITFQTSNNGGSDTNTNARYQFQFDKSRDGYEHTATGDLGTLTVGQTVNRTERLTNVPIGNHRVRVFVDSTDAVDETNEVDNIRVLDIVIPPADPGLSITATPSQVQNGQTAVVSWTIGATYPMNCSVFGPGITTVTFNPSTSPTSGTRTTAPITAKSEYTLRCVEPVTGTVFTDTATVETQGVIEEI